MTMFKVLCLDDDRHEVLSGIVRADDGERWDSLVQALNDLGSIGFNVQIPIYGPGPRSAGAGPIIEAFLLVSESATLTLDLQRRIKRTKALLADAQNHLATLSSDMERTLQEQRVRELCAELHQIEQRLPSSATGVEPPTDPLGKLAARMSDLAQQAVHHFEQNDFDKALSVLKELKTIANRRDNT